MSPQTWTNFWSYFLYAAIGLYFLVAIVVAVGAAFDVAWLLRLLGQPPPGPTSTEQSSPANNQN
ncbi:MAG: hypothetical protein ACE5K7_07545 [Phycisphaerae bacterium]